MPPLMTRFACGPLMLVNELFDRSTLILGGAGVGLRHPAGRMLLGICGLALMFINTD